MRRLSLPIVIVLSFAIAACLTTLALAQAPDHKVENPTETTPLAPFKRIEISGVANIILVQGTNGPLVASVPQNADARVSIKVQKETLMIKSADGGRWWSNLFGRGPTTTTQLTINFKDLENIDVSGGVRISAREIRVPALRIDGSGGTTIAIDDLRASTLTIDGSGAVKADIAGQVTEQRISISGAADYQAAKLQSDTASVDVSGAGKIVVNVRKKLNASISGAGTVEYIGDPAVTQSISGAGRVKRRETADADGPRIALHN
jgi:Putative auto-transporter adhesin, head GIN domain